MFKQHGEEHILPVSVHQKFLHVMHGMVGEVHDAHRGIV
jgi:hypothetical protein